MRAAFLLLAAAPLLLMACGATAPRISAVSAKPGKRVPAGVLTRALLKTASVPSEHVTIAETISLSLTWPLSKTCTITTRTIGDVDNVRHTARYDEAGVPVVFSGANAYEKNGRRWVEVPHAILLERAFPLSSAGFGRFLPSFLKRLLPRRVSDVASARIDGVRTTAYRVWIGRDTGLREPIEMWTDRSGRIRQARFSAGSGELVTVDLSHFGERVHMTVPKDAVPMTAHARLGEELIAKGHSCK